MEKQIAPASNIFCIPYYITFLNTTDRLFWHVKLP